MRYTASRLVGKDGTRVAYMGSQLKGFKTYQCFTDFKLECEIYFKNGHNKTKGLKTFKLFTKHERIEQTYERTSCEKTNRGKSK